jgi:hypothetical protein
MPGEPSVGACDIVAERERQLAALHDDIRAGFREHGLPYLPHGQPRLRIIYRTVQRGFGAESPSNLLSAQAGPGDWTVFLDFHDARLTADNLHRVYAFPDAVGRQSFPLLARPHLHRPKVDLAQIPARFVFRSLDDLWTRLSGAALSA